MKKTLKTLMLIGAIALGMNFCGGKSPGSRRNNGCGNYGDRGNNYSTGNHYKGGRTKYEAAYY